MTNDLHISMNLAILRPATIVEIANSLLREIRELHENHNDNEIVVKAREAHQEILAYLATTYGDEALDDIES